MNPDPTGVLRRTTGSLWDWWVHSSRFTTSSTLFLLSTLRFETPATFLFLHPPLRFGREEPKDGGQFDSVSFMDDCKCLQTVHQLLNVKVNVREDRFIDDTAINLDSNLRRVTRGSRSDDKEYKRFARSVGKKRNRGTKAPTNGRAFYKETHKRAPRLEHPRRLRTSANYRFVLTRRG